MKSNNENVYKFKLPTKSKVYEGETKNGKFHGKGTLTFEDGIKYEGEFKDGLIHGKGTYTYLKGEKLFGNFKNNCLVDNQGVFIDDQGGKFEGIFGKGGMIKGIYTYINGDKYEGEFNGILPYGEGTWTFKDGSKYIGKFKDGLKHGRGVWTFEKQKFKYEGEFKNDKMNGQGTLFNENGGKIEGEFLNNRLTKGTITHPDGTIEKGMWKDGEKVNYLNLI